MSPRAGGGGVNRRFKNNYGYGLKECGIKLTFIFQAQNLNKLGSLSAPTPKAKQDEHKIYISQVLARYK